MKQKTPLLKKGEIKKLLKRHPKWSCNSKETLISRTFSFSNQIDALAFIARITVHAQVQNHHPEILFSFGKVKVSLTTNDAKGLTKYDADLLDKIDTLQIGG